MRDNKMNKYLVSMNVEYYDVDNQTWENSNSDLYFAHININKEHIDKYCPYEDAVVEFFQWYVWLDAADRECYNGYTEDVWKKEEAATASPAATYTTSELFYDSERVRIIDCNVEVQ